MEKTYTLNVLNTCTSQYEDVEVTKEVYDEYRRGEWRIKKNDDRHKAHETPFSELTGGDNGAFENFKEFADTKNTPENALMRKERILLANSALCGLSVTMRRRFLTHYQDRLTAKRIAKIEGVSEYTVKESLKVARKKLDRFLANSQISETPSKIVFPSYTSEWKNLTAL